MPQTATMVDVRALLPNTAWPRGSGFPTIIKKILNACYRVKLLRLRGRYCRLHTFLSRPELRFYTDICRPELHPPRWCCWSYTSQLPTFSVSKPNIIPVCRL